MRAIALKSEKALQFSLEAAKRAWSFARKPRNLNASYFRGRACHCPPNLPLHLLHSEALREACDLVFDEGSNVAHPARMQLPVHVAARAIGTIGPGTRVHVKADRMGAFVKHVLPHVRGPIVLVTGDSDYSPVRDHESLLADSRIAHWFAQNCDLPDAHPRLSPIPIGFDNPVYTKLDKRLGFLVTMALGKTPLDASLARNDIGDQRRIQEVRKSLRPTRDRPARALATFHQNQKLVSPDLRAIPDRQRAFDVLSPQSDACHFVTRRLKQEECWRAHDDFAFEISPRGNGLDCFRTWESLLLGSIPIVKTTSLDRLYREHGFPVVIVNDFEEVNPANLARWKSELAGTFDDRLVQKLTVGYWATAIRHAAHAALLSSGASMPNPDCTRMVPESDLAE